MTSSFAASKQSTDDPLIVRLLRSTQQLDPERLQELYNAPSKNEVSFEELIIRAGLADERQIAEAYSGHYLMPLFDPPEDTPPPVDPSVAQVLPSRLCRDHLIAPLSDDGQTLEVAIFSPDSLLLADEIKLLTGSSNAADVHDALGRRTLAQRPVRRRLVDQCGHQHQFGELRGSG